MTESKYLGVWDSRVDVIEDFFPTLSCASWITQASQSLTKMKKHE